MTWLTQSNVWMKIWGSNQKNEKNMSKKLFLVIFAHRIWKSIKFCRNGFFYFLDMINGSRDMSRESQKKIFFEKFFRNFFFNFFQLFFRFMSFLFVFCKKIENFFLKKIHAKNYLHGAKSSKIEKNEFFSIGYERGINFWQFLPTSHFWYL